MLRFILKKRNGFLILLLSLILSGCATAPPRDINNVCSMFEQYPSWYTAAKKSRNKWNVPISSQMAIIYYESHFVSDAQPPRQSILGIIPWSRPSSAYGYAQALDGTWSDYQKSTGNYSGSRDNFADAIDFVGWYTSNSSRRLGIPRNDAGKLYLAYHEGDGGYRRGTHYKKRWLLNKSRKVTNKGRIYYRQLINCEARLNRESSSSFW